jgi:hypothetical protein
MQSGNLSSIRRRKPRRVLTVKMLAAKTAWLDARLRWRDGRVVWDRPGGPLVPRPADLAAARRALDEIARYPVAAGRALGDVEGLIERRRRRLEIAKLLCEVHEPDLSALAREARGGSGRAMHRLLRTLVAGALCGEPLPVEPCRAVIACAGGAEPLLRRLLDDAEAPREGRALAAMTLGALHGASTTIPLARDPWIRRAYGWGRSAGLPSDPSTILTLLAESNGEDLARRLLAAQSVESRFHPPASLLRDMFADGVAAERVVTVVEACADAAPIADLLLEYRSLLPDPASGKCRKAAAERFAAVREETLASLVDIVHCFLRSTPDPAVVRTVATLVRSLRLFPEFSSEVARALTAVLRVGSDLPDELRLPFLNLLVDCQHRIWNFSTLQDPSKSGCVRVWFEDRLAKVVRPMRTLFERAPDARVVREAVEREAVGKLSEYWWRGAEKSWVVLQLGVDFGVSASSYLFDQLCSAVGSYTNASSARAAFLPLVRALADDTPEVRRSLLGHLLTVSFESRDGRRIVFPRFTRYVDRLRHVMVAHNDYYGIKYSVSALVEVERTAPDLADDVLDLTLTTPTTSGEDGEERNVFVEATRLGLAIAGNDREHFKTVFETVLRSTPAAGRDWFARGVAALDKHPAVRATCVASFERQARRCIALLTRFGQALALGASAVEPLAALNAIVGECGEHRTETYARARRLLGEDEALPAGVRRALDLPQKLERELAYIETLLEREPEREDLASRAASLRNRLVAGGANRLRVEAEKDANERLERATTEALLSAAERQMLACFRKQLVSLIGAEPDALRFDDDLLNAILMSVGVDENRKHVVRLIRAHVWGDGEWRERIPANVAFLESLAARGVDPTLWLGAHPHSFHCESAAGGRVRLAFECDPIRVLQMGNYFDTCLSAGSFNAFSAVANACELNKRVVYATDGEGRVVGRKLIGIDETGKLLGFHSYAGLHDDKGNEVLLAAFLDYLRAFAAACGLELADDGTVPKLFVDDWYDDGAVEWGG